MPQLKGIFAEKEGQLKYLGVHAVDILESEWIKLLEHERIPFLMREIRIKLNNE